MFIYYVLCPYRKKRGTEEASLQPVVVENGWATKRPRVNGCRNKRSVETDVESALNVAVKPEVELDAAVEVVQTLDVQTDSVLEAAQTDPLALDVQVPCDSVLDVAVQDEGVPQVVCIRRPSPSDTKKIKSMRVLCRPPTESSGKRKKRKSS